MSVRDPSRRKALKYGAMAALGLGAGVALGEVTGANRLVRAASPSGPDPVFSGTGIQFPSLTSDPSQLVGNMWYRSDLTAMKYSDGTNAHELAALDLAQTFKAAQTFNGGIVFDAAGSIAATSTFIEADGAGGNLLFNAPTDKAYHFQYAGASLFEFNPLPSTDSEFIMRSPANPTTDYITIYLQGVTNGGSTYIERTEGGSVVFDLAFTSNGLMAPSTDSGLTLGQSSNRWASVSSVVYDVYHASGASFPTAQLADGALNLGTGTAATDTQISRAAAGVVGLPGFKTAAGGTAPTTVSLTSGTAYTASTTQNTIITVGAGTVTAIAINGTTTGLTAGTFYLKANDTITVTFTASPTVLQMVA